MTPSEPPAYVVDGHVHFFPALTTGDEFLDTLAAHLPPAKHRGFFLFETTDRPPFAALDQGLSGRGWRMTSDSDEYTATFVRDEQVLRAFGGYQITTAERLEVLTIGVSPPAARNSLTRTLQLVFESGGVAIVPWGFGKWWFRRGKIVKRLIDDTAATPDRWYLGDIGGRGPYDSSLLRAGMRHRRPLIAGSDPLCLPGYHRHLGRYGTRWESPRWQEKLPDLAALRTLSPDDRLIPFGRRVSLATALSSQWRLRRRRG